MTGEKMALLELVEQASDGDFVREMLAFAADRMMTLTLTVPGQNDPIAPTHWSFGQMCSLVGAPSSYLRNLPAPLAAINLQHGLLSHRAELVIF
ncbi:hypothetical protein [Acetobacter sp.]|nr:hypothetical protein [Acetobacter sp.]MCI1300965.1 hypothetical protein [Acetobacter sp.]MCI1317263.1 hypothetical protein [Acetobacter sp.]